MIREDKNMMTLTRNNLVRILDRMDEENANNVKLDIHIKSYDCELYIEFGKKEVY